MWLLPSRGRREACQEALDAFAEHGSTPGVLYVHDSDYGDMRLPVGWIQVDGSEAQAGQMRWLFAQYPHELWYGWIADDNRPRTPDFDNELIRTAGLKNFVFCNGGQHKTGATHKGLPPSIPSCMLWGGDLVRQVGWWAPPWIKHTTIDEHWKAIAVCAGRARYRDDVVVEHLHWKTGLRPHDNTDDAWRPFHGDDMAAFARNRPKLAAIGKALK
jgi:hypothetical protein